MSESSIYVDFNELIEANLVLLSQHDTKLDFAGNEVLLFEGKQIAVYMDDEDENNYTDNLIASGTVERNNSGLFPVVRWNCRIDHNGVRSESDETAQILRGEDTVLIARKLLDITFHHANWRWVQDKCISLLDADSEDIRGLAVTCLGHLARIHRRLDKEKVVQVLLSKGGDKKMAGRIQDALEDIDMFVGKNLPYSGES